MGFLNFLKGGGGGIISSVIGGGMGLIANKKQANAQKEMQEASFEYGREMAEKQRQAELQRMGLQFDYNKRTAQYNQELAREMYKYTFDMQNKYNNPKAEVQRYKDAGLNTALLYGGGGAGGQSTSASSAGGAAPAVTSLQPMGIQVGLQAKQQAADIELTMAQANKLKAETLKESTVGMAQGVMELITSVNNNGKIKADKEKIKADIEQVGKTIEQIGANIELIKESKELTAFQNRINKLLENSFDYEADGKKYNFEDVILTRFYKEFLTENLKMEKEQIEYLNEKGVAERLAKDLNKIVEGKLNELSITEQTLKSKKIELDRATYELKNDKALGDIIQDLGGDSKYAKLLLNVINKLLGKR